MTQEKIDITPELRERLVAASINGSTVATKILEEMKKPRVEILKSPHANHFKSKKWTQNKNDDYKSLTLKIGYCMRDFSNENNPDHGVPDAAERPHNLVWCTPSQFALQFKNLEFTDAELDYFSSAIKENSKVTIKICNRFKDFETAYNGANYSIYCDSDASLQNSCMRGDTTAEIAADFYKNFAGCKILVATNGRHEVVGRAIIWQGVDLYNHSNEGKQASNLSFMDRKYHSFFFIKKLMADYAKAHGIDLIKQYDDYTHLCEVLPTRDIALSSGDTLFADRSYRVCMRKDVPHIKWHRAGAPYVDTMCYVMLASDNQLYLSNYNTGVYNDCNMGECRRTDGIARRGADLCPCCGTHFHDYKDDDDDDLTLFLCPDCRKKLFTHTPLGNIHVGKLIKYKGVLLPAAVVKAKYFNTAFNIARLFSR